jgi:RNA polymerase-binding transcription factor DksA
MGEIKGIARISAEFIADQKIRIQRIIDNKKDQVNLLRENLTSTELQDRTKVESSQNIHRIETEILKLETTLRTISDNKDYGTCLDCGTSIPLERLKFAPTTERCVSCAAIKERKN